jgi:hypothetical protein
VLAHAQYVARAAHLQVAHGNPKSCTQVGLLRQRFEPLVAFRRGLVAPIGEEIGVGAGRAAAHPAPQLVELGQPKGVSPVHDQRVSVGDIQARLDDGRAQQYVDLDRGELVHHLR